jgi:hypothetical protein
MQKVVVFNCNLGHNRCMKCGKGVVMKGSIRVFIGFLLVFGAVGGMDTGTDAELPVQLAVAVVGLLSMYSGAKAMERV